MNRYTFTDDQGTQFEADAGVIELIERGNGHWRIEVEGDETCRVPLSLVVNNQPSEGDYLVRHLDGHFTWVTKDDFDAAIAPQPPAPDEGIGSGLSDPGELLE